MFRGLIAVASLALSVSVALAQDAYPSRNVTIIVPLAAGSGTDIMARVLATGLTAKFGKSFIVENRPGANAITGAEYAARQPNDGYTLMFGGNGTHSANPHLSKNIKYDPIKDFTHIAYVGGPPNVFVVSPALGVRSLKELAELGRRGEPIDYVSPGVGTLGHLLAESFAQRAGIKLQQIMTRGASQGLMDLGATVKARCRAQDHRSSTTENIEAADLQL